MILANIPKSLEDYTGFRIVKHLLGQRKNAFLGNWALMSSNYGMTVDAQLLERQIMFCEETKDALYDKVWEKTNYIPGSRPELEALVHSLTDGEDTQFKKAMRLMCLCRDLYVKTGGVTLYFGGTEEELIEKGEQLCECLGRLFVSLCEIIGIAGRIITHICGGHITSEVFLDGKWVYIDPRFGIFFVKKNGEAASLWEVWQNPEMIDAQPDWVKEYAAKNQGWDRRAYRSRTLFFNKNEINTVKPYSLSESYLYNYGKLSEDDTYRLGINDAETFYDRVSKIALGVPVDSIEAGINFSIKDGEEISEPTLLFANGRKLAVEPIKVNFYLDGELIKAAEKEPIFEEGRIYPRYVFFPCEEHYLDPNKINEGVHLLYAEDDEAKYINGSVKFTVKRKG